MPPRFLLFSAAVLSLTSATAWCVHRPTGSTRPQQQNPDAGDRERSAAKALRGRHQIYAGDDHAPLTGGRDDGAVAPLTRVARIACLYGPMSDVLFSPVFGCKMSFSA